MSDKTRKEPDQQWFDDNMRKPAEQMDKLFEPAAPGLAQFERMVLEHRKTVKKKQWRDIGLLWLAGCFIFSFMMWLADRHLAWFIAGQLTVAAGALATVGMKFGRRLRRGWKG